MKYLYTLFLILASAWAITAQNQAAFYFATVPTKGYEGCKFKFSAAVRMDSKDTNANARLFLRIDKPTGVAFHEDMQENPIRDRQWKTYSIEGIIDSAATRITLGVMAVGQGSFYYDHLHLDFETKNGERKTLYKNDFDAEKIDLRRGALSRYRVDTLYKAEIVHAEANDFLKIEAPDAVEIYKKNASSLAEDSNKVNMIYLIATLYNDKKDRDRALEYFKKGLDLAHKIGFERGQLRYFYAIGNMYEYTVPKNNDKAIEFYKKGLEYSQKIAASRDVAAFANRLTSLYDDIGNVPEAMKYIYVRLKEYELLQDKPNIADCYLDLAYYMGVQKNYTNALAYYRNALNIVEKLNDKNSIAQCYLAMGGIYPELGLLDTAQTSLNKAVDIFTELGAKAQRWGLPLSYLYMAKIQMKRAELSTERKETSKVSAHLKEALAYYQKSQKLYRGQYSIIVADRMNIQIGIAHFKLNNPVLADSFLTIGAKALERAEYANMPEFIEDKRDANLYLSRIDSIRGNWKDSHAHYLQYIAARDKLYNEENTKNATTYQLQYEFDLKEAAQKAEQEKKELALQKELELKALNFEYEKKQAAAKSEKEKQQLRYEQQLKQQQIEASYARKTAQIEAEQKRKEAVAKLEQEKRDALNASALALSQAEVQRQSSQRNFFITAFALLAVLLGFIGYAFTQKQKANKLLQEQKAEIDQKSAQLEQSLTELKATQAQLIQSEKLASLGELTAGIAHEIQNPLNFVNNFAEVSAEMIDELKEELEKGDIEEVKAIAEDLQVNLGKINHHGGRASSIVKGMLEHSRTSTGVKEPTDLNALADEYLRLSYHGLRAKDSSFNATMETHFEPDLPKVSVISQDIGRVLLNLINNAFYAVHQRTVETLHATSLQQSPYHPTVTISTQKTDNQIIISVQDNGNGIPESIRDKIFQPFYTTKPSGQGTGLGLSLAYDIITKGHGGKIHLDSAENQGSTFTIELPFTNPKN